MQRERLSEPTSCNKGDAIVWSLWKHREVGGTETTYPLSSLMEFLSLSIMVKYGQGGIAMLMKICPSCGVEFKVWPYEYDRRKYCSKICKDTAQIGSLNPKRSRRVTKTCPTCKIEFSVKKSHAEKSVYCSRKCMAAGYTKERFKKTCLSCEKEFKVYNNEHRADARFCSIKCRSTYYSGENHPQFIDGKGGPSHTDPTIKREYQRKYFEKNKEDIMKKLYLQKAKRRTMTEPGHTWKEWLDLLKKHDNKCFYCGVKMTKKMGPKQRTRDHIIPLTKGGKDTIDNIVPACRSCNSSKGTKSQEEFMRQS